MLENWFVLSTATTALLLGQGCTVTGPPVPPRPAAPPMLPPVAPPMLPPVAPPMLPPMLPATPGVPPVPVSPAPPLPAAPRGAATGVAGVAASAGAAAPAAPFPAEPLCAYGLPSEHAIADTRTSAIVTCSRGAIGIRSLRVCLKYKIQAPRSARTVSLCTALLGNGEVNFFKVPERRATYMCSDLPRRQRLAVTD